VVTTALAAWVRDARADEVSPKGKGIAGGALLGAEVVTIIESIAGVHAGWLYGVGALVGAGGGGVGGYFVEKGNKDGKVPMYLLAGGLALVIPAIVLTLNGTRYMPEEGATEDRAPTAPAAEPGVPGGTVTGAPPDVAAPPPPSSPSLSSPPLSSPPAATPPPEPTSPPPPQSKVGPPSKNKKRLGLSLIDVHEGALRIGVPIPDVRPIFSMVERRQYGVRDEAELRLPVLDVTF
jgi:hypothetical protein